MEINNFTVVESIYGRIIVNRNCDYQIDALAKTGKTHIESELHMIFQIVDQLPEGAIILDGGTNIGLVSIPIAQRVKNRDIKIIGFEPQKMIFSALSGSIVLNDLSNIWLHNKALGKEITTVTIPQVDYGTRADYGQVSVSKNKVVEHDFMRSQTVDCVTVDSMNLPRLDFIKLDVEGFELNVLEGAAETIKQFSPVIWIEYHLIGKANIEQVLSSLGNYSYHIMDQQNLLCCPE